MNEGLGTGPSRGNKLPGNRDTSGRGVTPAGQVLLKSAGELVLLFQQFSGASRLQEAITTLVPAGVSNFCWREDLCEPRQV